MILAQKKAKIFRTQETASPTQVEQAGAGEGNAPGARAHGAEAVEQSAQMDGRATGTDSQGSAGRFEVDLLDYWCKP